EGRVGGVLRAQEAHGALLSSMQQAWASHAARQELIAERIGLLSETLMELKQRSDRPLLYRLNRKWQARKVRGVQRAGDWEVAVLPRANVVLSADGKWQGSERDPQFSLRMKGVNGEP